ncbi:hypothetical protein N2152v2_004071 [Parachlorella kessleri]
MDRYQQCIETAAGQRPEIAAQLAELGELYQKKLWHQLTVKLESYIELESFQRGGFLISLYQNFIAGFAHKINLLKLAVFASQVSKQIQDPQEAIGFVKDVISGLEASKQPDTAEPVLYLRMQLAQYCLLGADLAQCKELVEAGREQLDTLADVDPTVSAAVYYAASLYHRELKEFAAYYKAALMYLAFEQLDRLDDKTKLALAVDVSLASLLGEDVYNFGELLLHPILEVLPGGGYGWLKEMLECFNSGDIHRYDELCAKYATVLNAQPELVKHERRLREKITVLCLMELIASLPAEERTVPMATIGERAKLPLDGVEFLLMKTLALHLIEGVIDQVEGTVQVSWVQPRILTMPQVSGLATRLDGWVDKVATAALTLEEEAVGVVEPAAA